MKQIIAVALFVAASAASVQAELKYTLKMSVKTSAGPSQPADPTLASIGGIVMEMIVPGGSSEITVLSGERGTRLEASKGLVGLPQGAVVLQRPDGSIVGIDHASKTFWKSGSADIAGIQATNKRTGEFSTVAGERVERVTFRIELPLGDALKASGLPPIVIDGDAWVAERFRKYTVIKGAKAPGALGLIQLAELGLSMRQVMRSRMFGDKEIESVVTNVSEDPAPASMFEIPAGYKEVPGPGKIGG